MSYTQIDLSTFPRRDHFNLFRHYTNPYVGVTVEVDITSALSSIRARELPFFLTIFHAMVKAANSVPEFRQRIVGDGIIEYDHCDGSYVCAREDHTYCYVTPPHEDDLLRFIPIAQAEQKAALENPALEETGDVRSQLFFSSTPWFSFTSVQEPTPFPVDSNPRFLFGKYHESQGKTLLPVHILVNHALCDGWHIHQVLSAFEENLKALTRPVNPPIPVPEENSFF